MTQPGSLKVVVLGYVVRGPLGGLAWHHLQYVLGLTDLGHDVLFLETNVDDAHGCYDPSVDEMVDDPSYGLGFAADTFGAVGLADCWAYLHASTDGPAPAGWAGPAAHRVVSFCRDADLLLNVSGVTALCEPFDDIAVRVLVDTDPVFQQVKVLSEPAHAEYVGRHTSRFTFAACIGGPTHRVPDDGMDWQPTVQPVHLAAWQPTPVPAGGALTTVMQWDSYLCRSWDGISYGMKSQSFTPYQDLPGKVSVPLEIALGSPAAPRTELAEQGWDVRDPLSVTRSIASYQAYLAGSLGEFSVAKHGYVEGHSGWFSERSANYLASGRPVIVQDTGFSELFECGEGLLAFSGPDEAIEAIEAVAAAPGLHGVRAREVAEEHFDARRVLVHLLERAR